MASNHIFFDSGLPHGRLLRHALTLNENASDGTAHADVALTDVLAMLTAMLSGDGSDDTHYAEIQVRLGCASNAKARSLYEELASACGNANNGAATQTAVKAAKDQLFAWLRG